MTTFRRIYRELQRMNDTTIMKIEFNEENPLKWNVNLFGQEGTRFAGQSFPLEIVFPVSYPFNPPTLRFLIKVDHISISNDGLVCMDILDNRWSPAFTAEMVIIAALSLLNDSTEQIIDDVKKTIMELREKRMTYKNHVNLQIKVKELKSKSQRLLHAY